jgi:hypothetical protein
MSSGLHVNDVSAGVHHLRLSCRCSVPVQNATVTGTTTTWLEYASLQTSRSAFQSSPVSCMQEYARSEEQCRIRNSRRFIHSTSLWSNAVLWGVHVQVLCTNLLGCWLCKCKTWRLCSACVLTHFLVDRVLASAVLQGCDSWHVGSSAQDGQALIIASVQVTSPTDEVDRTEGEEKNS